MRGAIRRKSSASASRLLPEPIRRTSSASSSSICINAHFMCNGEAARYTSGFQYQAILTKAIHYAQGGGTMAKTTEIAPNVYRISIYAPWGDLQFNHFLVKDDEPLLFHTGLRGMHAEIREAVAKLINLGDLRHISFSHFESDECGSLNEWLAAAPRADVICGQLGAMVTVNDFIGRESRALADGATLSTGKYRFRYCQTPHLPHGWDAGALFEETQKTLFCSDLFHQTGDVEPLTSEDVVG